MAITFSILFLIFAGVSGNCLSRNYGDCYFLEDIFNILEEALEPAGNCSYYLADPSLIYFQVYTSENSTIPTKYTGSSSKINLDTTKETKFLIHGWTESGNERWLEEIVEAYFKTGYDYNVIIIDWSTYSIQSYPKAVCYVPTVAEAIANFIIHAQLQLAKIHVIGHSLGGQVAGYIGQSVQVSQGGKKLNRITGLDAAGPLYCFPVLVDVNERLSSDDADFVDAIHTNGGVFGCFPDYGTVDFKPNCGTQQAGCPRNALEAALVNFSIDTFNKIIFCSHHRSRIYFIESIYRDSCFLGLKCKNCLNFSRKLCSNDTKIKMGEYCPRDVNGNYYLFTKSKIQFCNN